MKIIKTKNYSEMSSKAAELLIKEIRKRSKNIILTYLGFEEGLNKGLTYTTNKTIVIRNSEVISFYKSRV